MSFKYHWARFEPTQFCSKSWNLEIAPTRAEAGGAAAAHVASSMLDGKPAGIWSFSSVQTVDWHPQVLLFAAITLQLHFGAQFVNSRSNAIRLQRNGFLLTLENPSVSDFEIPDLHVRSQRHGITKLGTLRSTYPVISAVNGEGQNMERTHLRHYVLILPLEWTADIRLCSIELLPICTMSSSPVGEYWSTTGQFRPVGAQTFTERLRQTTQRKVELQGLAMSYHLDVPMSTSKFRSSNITPSHQPCPSKQYHHHMCNSPNPDQHSADLKSALQVSMLIFKMACMHIWTNRIRPQTIHSHALGSSPMPSAGTNAGQQLLREEQSSAAMPKSWHSCTGVKILWPQVLIEKKHNKTNIFISFMMYCNYTAHITQLWTPRSTQLAEDSSYGHRSSGMHHASHCSLNSCTSWNNEAEFAWSSNAFPELTSWSNYSREKLCKNQMKNDENLRSPTGQAIVAQIGLQECDTLQSLQFFTGKAASS